jgi:hypothetical protein
VFNGAVDLNPRTGHTNHARLGCQSLSRTQLLAASCDRLYTQERANHTCRLITSVGDYLARLFALAERRFGYSSSTLWGRMSISGLLV